MSQAACNVSTQRPKRIGMGHLWTWTFLWGVDLSGSPQGTGGVRALLSLVDAGGSTRHYPSFDGNGNIVAWTSSGATSPSCLREYDAFGNVLVEQGTPPCGFGFSTKIEDPETGLVYYGYRYLKTLDGRWISKDPIGEEGGTNLYNFVGNRGTLSVDISGLIILTACPIDDLLKSHLVTDYTRTKSGKYRYEGRAKFKYFDLRSEILARMIATQRVFEVVDTLGSEHVGYGAATTDTAAIEHYYLERHVEARARICGVAQDAAKLWQFSLDQSRYPPAAFDGKAGILHPKEIPEAIKQMNTGRYGLSCRNAQELVLLSIIDPGDRNSVFTALDEATDPADWIPGDGGGISNPRWKRRGNEGENLVYTGKASFYGNIKGPRLRLLSQWYEEVMSWNGAATLEHHRKRPWIGIKGAGSKSSTKSSLDMPGTNGVP